MIYSNETLELVKCKSGDIITDCKIKKLDIRGLEITQLNICSSEIETMVLDSITKGIKLYNVKIKNVGIEYKFRKSISNIFNNMNCKIENLYILFNHKRKEVYDFLNIDNSFNDIYIENIKIIDNTCSNIEVNNSFNCNNKNKTLVEINGRLCSITNSFNKENSQIDINCKLEMLDCPSDIFSEFIIKDGEPSIKIGGIYYDLEYIRMLNNYNPNRLIITSLNKMESICDEKIKEDYKLIKNKLKLLGLVKDDIYYNYRNSAFAVNYNTLFRLLNSIKNNDKQNKLNNKANKLFGNLNIENNRLISLLNYITIFGKENLEKSGTSLSIRYLIVDNVEIANTIFENKLGKTSYLIEINKVGVLIKNMLLEQSLLNSKRIYMNYKVGDEIIDNYYNDFSKYSDDLKIIRDGIIEVGENKLLDLMYSRLIEFKVGNFNVRTITKIIDLNGDLNGTK